MNMKGFLVGAAAIAASSAACADTLNLAQFLPTPFPASTDYSSPLSGVTAGGVDYTMYSPSGAFYVYNEYPNAYDGPWYGIFKANSAVLFDGDYTTSTSGPVTVDFSSLIASLTVAAQSNLFGSFNEYMVAYSGGSPVDSISISGLTSGIDPGAATSMTVAYAGGISSVVIGTTNESYGFALGASGVPELSTWAMMLVGFAGLGFAGYCSSRKSLVAA